MNQVLSLPYQTIEVRKLTPHIGAEIAGVDLSRPLGNQQFQEVRRIGAAPGVTAFAGGRSGARWLVGVCPSPRFARVRPA
jgi:hypothetical protein